MKFAIPLANGKLTAHFGHCQEFVLIEVAECIKRFLKMQQNLMQLISCLQMMNLSELSPIESEC